MVHTIDYLSPFDSSTNTRLSPSNKEGRSELGTLSDTHCLLFINIQMRFIHGKGIIAPAAFEQIVKDM